MRGRPAVALVVVAFRRPRELRALIAATRDPGIEQIVVNVEGDSQVTEISSGMACRNVILPDNRGYAAAVNAGVAASTAPTVVFSNDDVYCTAAVVLGLARRCNEAGIVTVPQVTDGARSALRTIQAALTVRSLALEWMVLPDAPVPALARHLNVEKWRQPAGPELVPGASAVMVAAPRDLLLEVPLPEAYFMYWEEAEWFVRLARRGVGVEYRPDLTVTHLGGRSVTSPEKQALLARNAVRCLRRLYGPRAAALGWPVTVAWHARLVVTGAARVALLRDGTASAASRRVLLHARVAGLFAALGAWREIR